MRLTVFLLLILAQVSTQAADRPASEALAIVRAAGFTHIRDVASPDIESIRAGSPLPGSPAATATEGAATATGLVAPTRGLSASTESGLLLVGAFLASLPVAAPENSSRLLVWLPKDLASTPESAQARVREDLLKALRLSLPQGQVELKEREVRHALDTRWYFSISDPSCADCRLFSPLTEARNLPELKAAPAFLPTGNTFAWGGMGTHGNGSFVGYPWTAKEMTPAQRQEFLERLSSHLPSYMYLYTPPDPRLVRYPQVFHQGSVLLFVDPALSSTSPAT